MQPEGWLVSARRGFVFRKLWLVKAVGTALGHDGIFPCLFLGCSTNPFYPVTTMPLTGAGPG